MYSSKHNAITALKKYAVSALVAAGCPEVLAEQNTQHITWVKSEVPGMLPCTVELPYTGGPSEEFTLAGYILKTQHGYSVFANSAWATNNEGWFVEVLPQG